MVGHYSPKKNNNNLKLDWKKKSGNNLIDLNYYLITRTIVWLLLCFCYVILTSEYYVVDSGYPYTKGFLPPYWGERYYL